MSAVLSVSIIVPVLNEGWGLPALLRHLEALQSKHGKQFEVIFVDGGSADDSLALLEESPFRVIRSERGRALQMNSGAAVARGEILLFLHADSRLPANVFELMALFGQRADRSWGRFDVSISGEHPMFAVIAQCMNWRSRLTGIATGDQALFVKRMVFERLGGFPEQPLMEDVALSAALRRESPPFCVRALVQTSGRRWQQFGVLKTILLMWRLRLLYSLGVPAEKLSKHYRFADGS